MKGSSGVALRVVVRGPVTPVCMAECRVAAGCGHCASFSRKGRARARVTTGRTEPWRDALSGAYGVRVPHHPTPPDQAGLRTVDAGRIKRVNFYIDSGMGCATGCR